MSHIAFESGQGRVEIGGRERARMGVLVDELAWAMHNRGRHHGRPGAEYDAKLRWIYAGSFDGSSIDPEERFAERLGWVCLIGNDLLRLIAHLHGQCEIHGWVHPDDRMWFADLVDRTVAAGLLTEDGRDNYGTWPEVADLARRSTSPLVSSYSGCDGWPEPRLIAGARPDLFDIGVDTGDEDDPGDGWWDAWARLGEAEQERIADEAIADCAPRWWPPEWGIWAGRVTGRNPWPVTA